MPTDAEDGSYNGGRDKARYYNTPDVLHVLLDEACRKLATLGSECDFVSVPQCSRKKKLTYQELPRYHEATHRLSNQARQLQSRRNS